MSHYCQECRGFPGGPCEFPITCVLCDASVMEYDADTAGWEDGRCSDCIAEEEEYGSTEQE
jgi:hypothetical protein